MRSCVICKDFYDCIKCKTKRDSALQTYKATDLNKQYRKTADNCGNYKQLEYHYEL